MKNNFEVADTKEKEKEETMYYELLCNSGNSHYWLASCSNDAYHNSYSRFGIFHIWEGVVSSRFVFYSNNESQARENYIRPVVSIPINAIK